MVHGKQVFTICLQFGSLLISLGACSSTEETLYGEAQNLYEYMQDIRRTLHAYPELMWEEVQTSEYIRKCLKDLDISFKYPVAKTGIVATIGTGKAPKFALRSDIDALPIFEEVDVPYKSKNDGKMHACGHDTHVAMLLGAARLLKEREGELSGTVVLLFQPAEEGGAGGKFMVEEGVLEGVSGIHGVHVMPTIPSGIITTKDDTLMAGADEFQITIEGRGGHAAMPHRTIDPVVAATAVVNSLQHLISRVTDPTEGAVISVTRFNTGEGATNVIPDSVKLGGTMRALSIPQFNKLRKQITKVVKTVSEAHSCSTIIEWAAIPYIPVVNDPKMVSLVETVVSRFEGIGTWQRLKAPLMAGEDFAFLAAAVPGVFTYLGIYNESAGAIHGLHTSRLVVDETVLPRGAALHAAVALEFFRYNHNAAASKEEL